MRVVGLHRLPWDDARYEDDVAGFAGRSDEYELRLQWRENWENAWIVVIESDQPAAQLDFGDFAHPAPSPSAQVPWLEQILEETPTFTKAAFFLHYVDCAKPLWFAGKAFALPLPTPAPIGLSIRLEYSSPD